MNTQFRFQTLEDSLIATICYFAIFQYPLTLFEIWNYLLCPPQSTTTIEDIDKCISTSHNVSSVVDHAQGLVFLKGRMSDTALRFDRYRNAEAQYLLALWGIRVLSCIPFVGCICVVNRLSYSNAKEQSDIDLLIIAKHRYLWLTRFLCTSLMHILRRRPGQCAPQKALCLSFFVSDEHLSLQALQIPQDQDGIGDIHFALWLTQCVPIYDRGGVYERWYKENAWVNAFVPNRIPIYPPERRRVKNSWICIMIKNIGECIIRCFGKLGELVARKYQQTFLADDIKRVVNQDTCVVMNDAVLKFHTNDRRHEVRKTFKKILHELWLE